jgi:hypothetical protein
LRLERAVCSGGESKRLCRGAGDLQSGKFFVELESRFPSILIITTRMHENQDREIDNISTVVFSYFINVFTYFM